MALKASCRPKLGELIDKLKELGADLVTTEENLRKDMGKALQRLLQPKRLMILNEIKSHHAHQN